MSEALRCERCPAALRAACALREDCPPKDCAWYRQALAFALERLPGGWDAFLRVDEQRGLLYLCHDHILVLETGDPAEFLGQVLLRAQWPDLL